MYSNASDLSNCTIIYQRDSKQISFEFDRGWEGIPFNVIFNSAFFFVSFLQPTTGLMIALFTDFDVHVCTPEATGVG